MRWRKSRGVMFGVFALVLLGYLCVEIQPSIFALIRPAVISARQAGVTSQEQAVAEERERCALIALTAREGTPLGPVTDAAIRCGKDRGCDPPQAEKNDFRISVYTEVLNGSRVKS